MTPRPHYTFQVTLTFRAPEATLARRLHWLAGLLRRTLRGQGYSHVEVQIMRARLRRPTPSGVRR